MSSSSRSSTRSSARRSSVGIAEELFSELGCDKHGRRVTAVYKEEEEEAAVASVSFHPDARSPAEARVYGSFLHGDDPDLALRRIQQQKSQSLRDLEVDEFKNDYGLQTKSGRGSVPQRGSSSTLEHIDEEDVADSERDFRGVSLFEDSTKMIPAVSTRSSSRMAQNRWKIAAKKLRNMTLLSDRCYAADQNRVPVYLTDAVARRLLAEDFGLIDRRKQLSDKLDFLEQTRSDTDVLMHTLTKRTEEAHYLQNQCAEIDATLRGFREKQHGDALAKHRESQQPEKPVKHLFSSRRSGASAGSAESAENTTEAVLLDATAKMHAVLLKAAERDGQDSPGRVLVSPKFRGAVTPLSAAVALLHRNAAAKDSRRAQAGPASGGRRADRGLSLDNDREKREDLLEYHVKHQASDVFGLRALTPLQQAKLIVRYVETLVDIEHQNRREAAETVTNFVDLMRKTVRESQLSGSLSAAQSQLGAAGGRMTLGFATEQEGNQPEKLKDDRESDGEPDEDAAEPGEDAELAEDAEESLSDLLDRIADEVILEMVGDREVPGVAMPAITGPKSEARKRASAAVAAEAGVETGAETREEASAATGEEAVADDRAFAQTPRPVEEERSPQSSLPATPPTERTVDTEDEDIPVLATRLNLSTAELPGGQPDRQSALARLHHRGSGEPSASGRTSVLKELGIIDRDLDSLKLPAVPPMVKGAEVRVATEGDAIERAERVEVAEAAKTAGPSATSAPSASSPSGSARTSIFKDLGIIKQSLEDLNLARPEFAPKSAQNPVGPPAGNKNAAIDDKRTPAIPEEGPEEETENANDNEDNNENNKDSTANKNDGKRTGFLFYGEEEDHLPDADSARPNETLRNFAAEYDQVRGVYDSEESEVPEVPEGSDPKEERAERGKGPLKGKLDLAFERDLFAEEEALDVELREELRAEAVASEALSRALSRAEASEGVSRSRGMSASVSLGSTGMDAIGSQSVVSLLEAMVDLIVERVQKCVREDEAALRKQARKIVAAKLMLSQNTASRSMLLDIGERRKREADEAKDSEKYPVGDVAVRPVRDDGDDADAVDDALDDAVDDTVRDAVEDVDTAVEGNQPGFRPSWSFVRPPPQGLRDGRGLEPRQQRQTRLQSGRLELRRL